MSSAGKIGFWMLLIGVVLASSLWILGGKRHEHSTGLEISASPSSVFEFLIDSENQKKWNTGLTEVGQFGPLQKDGSRTRVVKTPRVVTLEGGKQVKYEDQVIRFEPNQTLTVQSANQQAVITTIFQLESRGQKTFLTFRVKSKSRGLGRFLAPLTTVETQSRIDNDIKKLKELVESSQPPEDPIADSPNAAPPINSPTFSFQE
ncbi:MAG: SRPBCC domain-containing protein [Mariniblastus sp.]|nr:SRPBCC domain-containing protein [Mariniblastus sp.]